jgi:hypothetical protein
MGAATPAEAIARNCDKLKANGCHVAGSRAVASFSAMREPTIRQARKAAWEKYFRATAVLFSQGNNFRSGSTSTLPKFFLPR